MKGRRMGLSLGNTYGKERVTRIVITEGELDAATYGQLYPTWDVVSLPNGAAGAKKAVQKNLEFLQGYEEILLWFDNDEPGIQAAKEAAGVLPPGKVSIALLDGYKDLSDAWQAGDIMSIDAAFHKRKEYRPDGIVEGKSLLN